MITRHIINSIKDFESLERKWRRLETGRDMTVFQSYDWNLLVYDHYARGLYNRLWSKIMIYESANCIVPMIVQRVGVRFKRLGRKKGLYVLGEGTYSDYLNIVYSDFDAKEIRELINYILRDNHSKPLYFSFIRENTGLCKEFCASEQKILAKTISVEIRLPETEEKYLNGLSKNTKQNLRTAINRIRRDGIEYDLSIMDGIIDQNLADNLVPLHLKRVLEINSGGESIKRRVFNWIIRKQLVRQETKNNMVNRSMKKMSKSTLILCRLNNHIAGYLYGLKESGTVRILQNCFDHDYKFYSPMFRGAFDYITRMINEKKYGNIDFTRGGEEYKYKLGGVEVSLYSFVIDSVLK